MRCAILMLFVACGSNGHEAQHAANLADATAYRIDLELCLSSTKADAGTLRDFEACKAGVDAKHGKRDGGR